MKNRDKKLIIIYMLFFFLTGSVYGSNKTIIDANEAWWKGDYDTAELIYNSVLDLPDKREMALEELGSFYKSLGKYKKAKEIYETLTDEYKDSKYKIKLAFIYYCLHDYEESKKAYMELYEEIQDNYEINLGLSEVSAAINDYDKTIEFFRKTSRLKKNYPEPYILAGKAYNKKEDSDNALKYFKEALLKDTHQVELRFFLSDLYKEMNNYKASYKQLYKIKNVDSKNKNVLKGLTKLSKFADYKKEEIEKVRKLDRFRPLRVVEKRADIPEIRVAVNTNHRGRLNEKNTIRFISKSSFSIINEGKTIYMGDNKGEYIIKNTGDLKAALYNGENRQLAELPAKFIISSLDEEKGSFIIREIEYGKGFSWGGTEDRQYRRKLEISLVKNRFKIINIINLEEYLYGVVPSEMMISFDNEALKAQAVIARSYAYNRAKSIRTHRKQGFDLCDSQHCQVYKGVANEWKKSNNAVDATRAEFLYAYKKNTHPLFHSNCGGHTHSSEELKGWYKVSYLKGIKDAADSVLFNRSPASLESWLKSRPDTYCRNRSSKRAPEFRWFRSVNADLLTEKINRLKKIGKIKNIIVMKRNSSGYAGGVKIIGKKGNIVIEKEHKIRRYLAIGPLRSNLFWLETIYGKSGYPTEFRFYGGGWGHGVGMCQDGAGGMAIKGITYRDILKHYYTGAYIHNRQY